MRVLGTLPFVVATTVLCLVTGCKTEVQGKPISLAKFGGAVKLRLNVQKGDVFHYWRQTVDTDGMTKTQEFDYEVINSKPQGIQVLRTLTKIKIEGGDDFFGVNKATARRMRGMRVDQMHDKYASTLSMSAVSLDPDIQQIVAAEQTLGPGIAGIVFPEGAVKIGSQWHVDLDMSAISEFIGGGMDFGQEGSIAPVTYTFKAAEEFEGMNVAVVEYELNTKFAIENFLTMLAAAMNRSNSSRAEVSVAEKGVMRVDIATGMPVHDQAEAKLSMTLGNEKHEAVEKSQAFLRHLKRGGILSKFRE